MAGGEVLFNQKDVEAFSAKLEQWADGLDGKERALLEILLKSVPPSGAAGARVSDADLEKVSGGTMPRLELRSRVSGIILGLVNPGYTYQATMVDESREQN